jgi:hypothetical protein
MLHRRRLLNFNYKRKLTFKITFVFFPSLVAFVLQAQSPCRIGSEGTESHLTNYYSIFAFNGLLKVFSFLLDHFHGIGDLITFTNGRITKKNSQAKKYVSKSSHALYG